MSTHCYVGYEKKDGTIQFAYCHFDGYPWGIGQLLLHVTPDAAQAVINRGPMRTWNGPPADAPMGHAMNLKNFADEVKYGPTPYGYVLRQDGTWEVSIAALSGALLPLKQVIDAWIAVQ